MPSPRAPSRTILLPSAVIDRSEQEFLVTGAAADRRRDDVEHAPTDLSTKPIADELDRALLLGGRTHDAALADGGASHLELRLDQGNEPGPRARQGQRRRQRLGEGNEADIGDDGSDRFRHEAAVKPARITAFERHHALAASELG